MVREIRNVVEETNGTINTVKTNEYKLKDSIVSLKTAFSELNNNVNLVSKRFSGISDNINNINNAKHAMEKGIKKIESFSKVNCESATEVGNITGDLKHEFEEINKTIIDINNIIETLSEEMNKFTV